MYSVPLGICSDHLHQRNGDCHFESLCGVLCTDRAMMPPDDLPHDGKANAYAAAGRTFRPVETLKQMRQILTRCTAALILHSTKESRLRCFHADMNRTTLGHVLAGILQQIGESFAQPLFVTADDGIADDFHSTSRECGGKPCPA